MTDTPSIGFYDALAPLFDVMTDWDARLATEGPFLRGMLERAAARTVLDAACGSGGHALALASWGYQAAGADASQVMIALAQQKAAQAQVKVNFVVADLADIDDTAQGQRYDAVLCLGNSLPHLLTQADLVAALRGMAAVLRPGGVFITQNLNYDLRWQRQPRWFAAQGGVLDGEEVVVWRFADYEVDAGRIAFHIALFRKGPQGWRVDVHTTQQRPLFQADLLAGLAEADLVAAQTYSGMTWPPAPFEAERSGDLVVVARKP
jgi:SAM-dependent methyltransferase